MTPWRTPNPANLLSRSELLEPRIEALHEKKYSTISRGTSEDKIADLAFLDVMLLGIY